MKHHNTDDTIHTLVLWMATVLYATFALWLDSRIWLFFTGYFFGFAVFRTLTPSYDFWTKPYHKLIDLYEKELDRMSLKNMELKKKRKKK